VKHLITSHTDFIIRVKTKTLFLETTWVWHCYWIFQSLVFDDILQPNQKHFECKWVDFQSSSPFKNVFLYYLCQKTALSDTPWNAIMFIISKSHRIGFCQQPNGWISICEGLGPLFMMCIKGHFCDRIIWSFNVLCNSKSKAGTSDKTTDSSDP